MACGKCAALALSTVRAACFRATSNSTSLSGVSNLKQGLRFLNSQARAKYDYNQTRDHGMIDESEIQAVVDEASYEPDVNQKSADNKLQWSTKEMKVSGNKHSLASASESAAQLGPSDTPFLGISMEPFPKEIQNVLMGSLTVEDVEIKPDGMIYLPEIKYRRTLLRAFGPGGWALMPRGDPSHYQSEAEAAQLVTREYALFCMGRFVSQSVGEHVFYARTDLHIGRALESAKSNALMRCCKDLGIASELWDPQYVSNWRHENAIDVWCENVRTKEKKRLWKKSGSREVFPYPWKEQSKQ